MGGGGGGGGSGRMISEHYLHIIKRHVFVPVNSATR